MSRPRRIASRAETCTRAIFSGLNEEAANDTHPRGKTISASGPWQGACCHILSRISGRNASFMASAAPKTNGSDLPYELPWYVAIVSHVADNS